MGAGSPSTPAPPSTKQTSTQQYKAAIKFLPKLVQKDFNLQKKFTPKYIKEQLKQLPKQQRLQAEKAFGSLKLDGQLTEKNAQANLKLLNKFGNQYLKGNAREADKLTDTNLDLFAKYGDRIARTERKQMEALDPTAFAAREQVGKNVLSDLNLGSALSDGENREWEQSVRAAQASRGNILGNAPVTSEAMTKGNAGFQRYQQRLANAKGVGDSMLLPNQRPVISQAQSGRAMVPQIVPGMYNQYNQGTGGSGMGASAAGMQFFNSGMTPQVDPLGQYNAQVAASQANASRPNPWLKAGVGAASGALSGAVAGSAIPGIGTAIGAGVGAVGGGLMGLL